MVAHEVTRIGQYSLNAMPAQVPVHRTARARMTGELQVAEIHQEGTVAIAGVGSDAFAVRVEGDDLFPALRHGMLVVCDPAAPLVQGEWVLLEHLDGRSFLLELLIARDSEITAASINGEHRQTFLRSELRRVTPVTHTAFASRFKPRA